MGVEAWTAAVQGVEVRMNPRYGWFDLDSMTVTGTGSLSILDERA
jgi:hypothetical protein